MGIQNSAVLIIGGSRRIGFAVTRSFAAAGWDVAIGARTAGEEIERSRAALAAEGVRAEALIGDVTDPASCREMVDGAAQRLGRLDAVVNCAVRREHGGLEALALEDWHATLSSVLDGALLATRHALPHLERTGGTILLFSGASAYVGSEGPAVPTAKSGLEGFVRSAALTLGPRGVTINVLVPGRIDAPDDAPDKLARMERARPASAIPLRRAGTPEDVAAATVALCGGAFAYMTGQVIHLNGGLYMG